MQRLVVSAAAITLLAGCGGGTVSAPLPSLAWPMYRGDLARDGHPPAATLTASEATRLRLAWRASAGAAVEGTPAVAGGLVVVGTEGGSAEAFDERTGAIAWRLNGLGAISGSPAVAGSLVFVGTLTGRLYGIELATGRERWEWSAPGTKPAIWSSPGVVGGAVVVGIASQYGDTPLEAGRVIAVGAATGHLLWSACVEAGCAPGGGVWSSAAFDGAGRGYVGTGNPDDAVLAFDAATGRRLWAMSLYPDLDRDLDVGATPIVLRLGGREVVAEGSNGGVFAVLDASTGTIVWKSTLVEGSAVHGLIASPAFDGTTIYVPSASPPTGMFALDPGSGAVRWRHATDLPVYSAPVACDGLIVFGTGDVFGDRHRGELFALSAADGSVLWSFDVRSAVFGGPAAAGSTVVAGDEDGEVLAFRPG